MIQSLSIKEYASVHLGVCVVEEVDTDFSIYKKHGGVLFARLLLFRVRTDSSPDFVPCLVFCFHPLLFFFGF